MQLQPLSDYLWPSFSSLLLMCGPEAGSNNPVFSSSSDGLISHSLDMSVAPIVFLQNVLTKQSFPLNDTLTLLWALLSFYNNINLCPLSPEE
jgi:hypothetical protein